MFSWERKIENAPKKALNLDSRSVQEKVEEEEEEENGVELPLQRGPNGEPSQDNGFTFLFDR